MEFLDYWNTLRRILIIDFLRYFVPASLAYLIFWIILDRLISHKFIQKKKPSAKQLWFEFKYSLSTVVIFAIVGLGIVSAKQYGLLHIYGDFNTYGWPYFAFSLLFMVLFHDTYFYWTHRMMHHPMIYKHVHKVHHMSISPSPWAAYSFHPLEAIVQAMVLPVILFILPVHSLAIFLFLLYMILRNVLGHLGYELFPHVFVKSKWLNWHTTSTHHNMHHEKFNCNYGLYFSWWDNIMNTTHKEYQERFVKIAQRKKKDRNFHPKKFSFK